MEVGLLERVSKSSGEQNWVFDREKMYRVGINEEEGRY